MDTPNGNSPQAGDIVVYRPGVSGERFVLSVFRHVSQLWFGTRDDAVRDAVAFAAKDHVGAWYTEDGQAFERLAARRRRGRRRESGERSVWLPLASRHVGRHAQAGRR